MNELIVLLMQFMLIAPIVGRQLVREALVKRLQSLRSPVASEISDWTLSVGLPGYVKAIKSQYIWGEASRQLLASPETRRMIQLARGFDVAVWFFLGVTLVVLYLELAP